MQPSSIEEDDSIDPTDESSVESDVTEPFDPKDINITVEPKTMDNLVQRLLHEEIDIYPDFQRKGNLWPLAVQSRLIESLMLRFPLPAFYFDAESEENWLVVDGLQRLWTLKNFVVDKTNNRLRLGGLEILKQYDGMTYDELPRPMQRRIMETQVTAYIIKPGTPKAVKYNVFRRINTGGLTLNPMEIRHALNQGPAAQFLKILTENNQFKHYIRVSDRRMNDREVALRYIGFRLTSYREYVKPLTGFLDTAMEKLSRASEQDRAGLEEGLFRAFSITESWFGRDQFSRSYGVEGGKKLLNLALFEVWTSQVAVLPDHRIDRINQQLPEFQDHYKRLLRSDAFVSAITRATTDNRSILTRFEAIEQLINRYSQ